MDNMDVSPSKWNSKTISGKMIGLIMLGGLGLLVYDKILPFLLRVTWGTAQLAAACIIGGFALYIVTNKKFWRGIKYLTEAIAQWTLGFAIEMNPFNILYLKIERAERDREELLRQAQKLKAQQVDLQAQLTDSQTTMVNSASEIKVATTRLAKSPDDLDLQMALEKSTSDYNNAKDFLDGVTPIYNDISKLVAYADLAYRKSGNALEISKNTVKMAKAKYEAVTTGSNAMRQAMKAFAGDSGLNSDADLAYEKLRKDVSAKIGGIKQAIQLTSQFMNQQDLKDAGKVQQAIDAVNGINLDKTFGDQSITTVPLQQIGKNKYIEMLKK